MTENSARVYYRGGSSDGVTIDATPEVFHSHPQREVHGVDSDAPFELYRRVGEQTVTITDFDDQGQLVDQQVSAVVFEFDGAAAQRRLDDDMNPLEDEGAAGS